LLFTQDIPGAVVEGRDAGVVEIWRTQRKRENSQIRKSAICEKGYPTNTLALHPNIEHTS
jgi:hypothetical protein